MRASAGYGSGRARRPPARGARRCARRATRRRAGGDRHVVRRVRPRAAGVGGDHRLVRRRGRPTRCRSRRCSPACWRRGSPTSPGATWRPGGRAPATPVEDYGDPLPRRRRHRPPDRRPHPARPGAARVHPAARRSGRTRSPRTSCRRPPRSSPTAPAAGRWCCSSSWSAWAPRSSRRSSTAACCSARSPPAPRTSSAWLAAAALFTIIHFRPVEYPGLFAFAPRRRRLPARDRPPRHVDRDPRGVQRDRPAARNRLTAGIIAGRDDRSDRGRSAGRRARPTTTATAPSRSSTRRR